MAYTSGTISTTRTVERVVALIMAFKSKSELGLTEVSALAGLNKSTAYRLLRSLETADFVARDPETKLYRLGFAVGELGSLVMHNIEVHRIASPFLSRLHSRCGETIHLGVLHGDEAVYVDKLENVDRSIRLTSHVGKRVPLHCTGLGKVLLAFQDNTLIMGIVERKGLQRCTARTITSPDELYEHCAQIRRHGYAVDDREHNEFARCVGAPIFGLVGKVQAAISLTAVGVDVDSYRFHEYINLVCGTAREISKVLGYRYPAEPTLPVAVAV